jgi:hypothetical protein
MEVRLDAYRAEEFAALGEFFAKLASITAAREAAEPKDFALPAVASPESAVASPEPATEPVATRKPRAKRAEKAEPAPVAPAPEPQSAVDLDLGTAPAAPAPTPAPAVAETEPIYTKAILEEKTRALAKTDFEKVKAVLATFNVKRFGELAESEYQKYGDALSVL